MGLNYFETIQIVSYYARFTNMNMNLFLRPTVHVDVITVYIICDPKSKNRPYGACNF